MADQPASIADFADLARAVLAPGVWDYVAGGSGAEITLAANRAALDRVAVLPRALRGVDRPDTAVRLLPATSVASLPVAVAPMAYQGLLHPDGEPALAAAALDAGIPYVASTLSSHPIEEITATGAAVWFQVYLLRDRAEQRDLLARAEQAGCEALMVTVDVPVLGRRRRDLRNGFALPGEVTAANFRPAAGALAQAPVPGVSALARHTAATFATGLTWDDVTWLREQSRLPLVVKGILDPRDARLAVDAGADAVVVSNHGGRQLDGAVPAIVALPGVVEAVSALGGDHPVLLDSGIRDGTDVLRALASGAAGVLLGRPLLWALAAGGRDSATVALRMLGEELRDALELAGCATPGSASELSVVTLGADR